LGEGERVFARIRGFQSWVVVPMLRDDVTIGSIGVTSVCLHWLAPSRSLPLRPT
jgi:hypothetical protein